MQTNDEPNEQIETQNEAAANLTRAAARWALHTSAKWRGERPEDYARFKQAFDTGAAGLRIIVTMGFEDSHQLDIVGIVDGKEMPIAYQNVAPKAPDPVTH